MEREFPLFFRIRGILMLTTIFLIVIAIAMWPLIMVAGFFTLILMIAITYFVLSFLLAIFQ
jgi:hypothetical protein